MKEIQINKLSLQQHLTKLSPSLFNISNLLQEKKPVFERFDHVHSLPAVHNEATDTGTLTAKTKIMMRRDFGPSKK